jgi:5-methylcytosine-specific restriction endonuclease McrA
MWNFADDEGKIIANPLYLKSVIFPYDNIEVTEAMKEIEESFLVCKYIANRNEYYFIYNFLKHQKIDRPHHTNILNPNLSDGSVRQFFYNICAGICPDCGRELVLKDNPNAPNSYDETDFDWTTTLNGKDSRVLSIDHILSIDAGGTSNPNNLRALCITCNKRKGGKRNKSERNIRRQFDDNSTTNIESKEERESTKKKEESKKRYGDDVFLTEDEYNKLLVRLTSDSRVQSCIEILDNYLGQSEKNKKRYTSHYKAILNWVILKLEEREKNGTSQSGNRKSSGFVKKNYEFDKSKYPTLEGKA